MQLSKKQKGFSQFVSKFLKSTLNFEHFEKKMTLTADVFPQLHTYIPVSEDPSTSNMVRGTKHCWNLNDTPFTIFIDHCEGSWVGKSVSERYSKS